MTGHDVNVLRGVYNHLDPEVHGAQFQAANDTVTRLRGTQNGRILKSVTPKSDAG